MVLASVMLVPVLEVSPLAGRYVPEVRSGPTGPTYRVDWGRENGHLWLDRPLVVTLILVVKLILVTS